MMVPPQAFKAARIFMPPKIQEMAADISSVDEFNIFPFIDAATIEQLRAEFPQYFTTAADVNPSYSVCEF